MFLWQFQLGGGAKSTFPLLFMSNLGLLLSHGEKLCIKIENFISIQTKNKLIFLFSDSNIFITSWYCVKFMFLVGEVRFSKNSGGSVPHGDVYNACWGKATLIEPNVSSMPCSMTKIAKLGKNIKTVHFFMSTLRSWLSNGKSTRHPLHWQLFLPI